MSRSEGPAWTQIAIAGGVGVGAWFIAPHINSPRQHAEFVDFFAASASVIAALLIALAVEARSVVRTPFYAVVAAISVAISEVSAIAALSPTLPEWWIYHWLFALTVGGGVGALAATVAAGATLLRRDIENEQDKMLDALVKRRNADAGTTGGGA